MNNLSNLNMSEIIGKIATHVHKQAVQMRTDYEILEGMMKLYADYIIFPTENNEYICIHYVVHVDNETDRFFIVTWTPATEDEFLDSIEH